MAFALIAVNSPLEGGPAAVTTPGQPVASAGVAITADQVKAAIATSKALFKQGNFAAGEAALFAANRHATGTAAGSRDSGQALILMAFICLHDGDGATATKLAQAALEELQQAQPMAVNNNTLAANIDTLTGFVQERFNGARAQAEASYQAAVQISPATAKSASASLARLQAEDSVSALRATAAAHN